MGNLNHRYSMLKERSSYQLTLDFPGFALLVMRCKCSHPCGALTQRFLLTEVHVFYACMPALKITLLCTCVNTGGGSRVSQGCGKHARSHPPVRQSGYKVDDSVQMGGGQSDSGGGVWWSGHCSLCRCLWNVNLRPKEIGNSRNDSGAVGRTGG